MVAAKLFRFAVSAILLTSGLCGQQATHLVFEDHTGCRESGPLSGNDTGWSTAKVWLLHQMEGQSLQ